MPRESKYKMAGNNQHGPIMLNKPKENNREYKGIRGWEKEHNGTSLSNNMTPKVTMSLSVCLSVAQYEGLYKCPSVCHGRRWVEAGEQVSLFGHHGKWWSTFWGEQRANRNRSWPFTKQRTMVGTVNEKNQERGGKEREIDFGFLAPGIRLPNMQYRYLL